MCVCVCVTVKHCSVLEGGRIRTKKGEGRSKEEEEEAAQNEQSCPGKDKMTTTTERRMNSGQTCVFVCLFGERLEIPPHESEAVPKQQRLNRHRV